MATSIDTGSQTSGHRGAADEERSLSSSRIRVGAQQSDVRELRGRAPETAALEAKLAFELGASQKFDPIHPPSVDLGAAIDRYRRAVGPDSVGPASVVLHAMRVGDLPDAIVALVSENLQLRQDLEASQSDFEALRTVNVSIQQGMEASLGVADDQRIELLGQLEGAQDEISALELKVAELAAQLSDCQSRLPVEG